MRYLRTKHIRKALRQYQFLCGIKAPYRILVDGNFLAMCIQMKVDILTRMPKFIQTNESPIYYITKTSIKELEMIGLDVKEALNMAKKMNIIETNEINEDNGNNEMNNDINTSLKNEIDVSKSIKEVIGLSNDRKFIVATQDKSLREYLRNIPGVPLIYLNRSVLVFEDLSKATLKINRKDDKIYKSHLNEDEKKKVKLIKKQNKEIENEKERKKLKEIQNQVIVPRKKKRAKGPNPLSCKKKKI